MTRQIYKAPIAALFFACLLAISDAIAQEQQTPLPDVNVTAPAKTESFITRGFTPYDGHVRVEEDKWPAIPCATARISAGPAGKCQTGTPTENFLSRSGGEPGNCIIYHQLVTFQTATLSVEADSMIFGRVEDWRAGWPKNPDRATFPAPSTSHAACGFPALRAPICFMPRLMGPIMLGQLSVRRVAPDRH